MKKIITQAEAQLIAVEVVKAMGQSLCRFTPKKERYLTSNEAAAMLGVTQGHLYNMRNKIPHTKKGRLYYKESDLIKYIEEENERKREV